MTDTIEATAIHGDPDMPKGDEAKPIEDSKPLALPERVNKLGGNVAIHRGVVLPQTMQEVLEFSQIMCKAGEAIPKHLRMNPGMCLAVTMDAMAWQMNPFSVARFHMVVNGVGSYMSQLVTAVINSRAPIKGRLVPQFAGTGDKLVCRIEAETLDGQPLPYESPEVGQIKVKNSPLWATDPEQQLGYYSCRAWARRYFPDLLMGVYDPDEAATMKDVTPKDNFLDDEPNAP